MSLLSKGITCLAICLVCPLLAGAQNVSPAAAGATPQSANFDIWPDFLVHADGFRGYDITALGESPINHRDQFLVFGTGDDSWCGISKVTISKNGVDTPRSEAFVDDIGGVWGINAAAAANFGSSNGFGWDCGGVDSDPGTGNYAVSIIYFNDDIQYPFPNPLAGIAYGFNGPGPNEGGHAVFQRFNRSGSKVGNVTPGRNVPPGSHTLDPWWPALSHNSRPNGVAILSNGNTLYALRDSTSSGGEGSRTYYTDNGIVPGLTGGPATCLYSIATPAGVFVKSTTPTFVHQPSGASSDQDAGQQSDAGAGFFYIRTNDVTGQGSTLAVFRNNGARIAQLFNYGASGFTFPNPSDGGFDFGGKNNASCVASNGNLIYVAGRYNVLNAGNKVPCVLKFTVNGALTSVAKTAVITPADDATAPTGDIEAEGIGIECNQEGDLAVIWTEADNDGGAPVARVYNSDGTADTGSFYVSSLGDPTTDNTQLNLSGGDRTNKIAIYNNTVCAVWLSENGVATTNAVDCSGLPKGSNGSDWAAPISTVARVFTVSVTDVKDWDLY
jgi:hypothetical protein